MVKEEIRFELVSDVGKNVTVLKSVKFDANNDWHTVELEYTKGRFKLTVDNHNKPAQMFGKELLKSDYRDVSLLTITDGTEEKINFTKRLCN